jgi:hypothetical protein
MRAASLLGLSFAALMVSNASWADAPPPSRRVAEPVRSWGWEVGGRYWYSTGETNWNHNGNAVAPALGNPASVLTYDGLDAHSGEVFFRGDHLTGFFVKGYAGIGKVVDGSLDDEDYFVGQVKFSDTYSEQRDGRLGYLSADIGFTFYDSTRVYRRAGLKDAPREVHGVRLGAFVGYHHWNEKVHAFGVRCNPDDVGGAFCGPPGAVVVPFTTNVISNEVEWNSLRIGLSGEARLTRQLKIAGEAAWVPYARMKNEDSHHLRADLGPVPNILHDGSGSGVMLEGVITYDLTRQFSIGVGGRYWHLESDGSVVFGPTTINTTAPLNKLESDRYGAFVQGSLKF